MSKRPQTTEESNEQSTERATSSGLFPQFTRLFSATFSHPFVKLTGKLLLWSLLLVSIGINIFVYNPDIFAQVFPGNAVTKTDKVLGVSDPMAKETGIETVENDYQYWLGIIQDHPDYRDAHVYAAVAAYKLGKIDDSRAHLGKVRELDPNYSGINSLESLLLDR